MCYKLALVSRNAFFVDNTVALGQSALSVYHKKLLSTLRSHFANDIDEYYHSMEQQEYASDIKS